MSKLFLKNCHILRDIDGEEHEIDVEIEFDYTPAERGSREFGLQMEPDLPEDVDIVSVKDEKGTEYSLTKDETETFALKCLEHVHDLGDML